MPKAGFIVARVCFLVLAASMLGAAMLAAPPRVDVWRLHPSDHARWRSRATGSRPTAVVCGDHSGFNSQGGPVKVEVLDESGQLITAPRPP